MSYLIEKLRRYSDQLGGITGEAADEIEHLRGELAKMYELENERYRGWAKWFREQPKIETTTGTQSADGTLNLDLYMISDEATEHRRDNAKIIE